MTREAWIVAVGLALIVVVLLVAFEIERWRFRRRERGLRQIYRDAAVEARNDASQRLRR